MNKIELGINQIDSGDFQGGLDTIWAEIEAGSDKARVALSKKFASVGLHAFAQDQWLYLLEQGSEFTQEGTVGAFGNAVWMRRYGEAAELLDGNPALKTEFGTYLADSYRDFCTLSFEVDSFAEAVKQLIRDDHTLEAQRAQASTLDALRSQLVIREHLFNISCDLAFNPPGMHSQVAVDVPVAGGLTLPRPAIQAVGAPIDRANDLLTTVALTIAKFAEHGNFEDDAHFLEATRKGKSVSNKIILLLDEEEMSRNTSQGIEHVCWALGQSDSTDEKFAGFVLGAVTEDEDQKVGLAEAHSSPESSLARFCSSCGTALSNDSANLCSGCGATRV